MKKRRKSKSSSRRAQWARFSKEFREKSGKCAMCGAVEGVCVHHILQKRTHPAFWFETRNLICLCRSCHWKVHKGFEWEFMAWLMANRPS